MKKIANLGILRYKNLEYRGLKSKNYNFSISANTEIRKILNSDDEKPNIMKNSESWPYKSQDKKRIPGIAIPESQKSQSQRK